MTSFPHVPSFSLPFIFLDYRIHRNLIGTDLNPLILNLVLNLIDYPISNILGHLLIICIDAH